MVHIPTSYTYADVNPTSFALQSFSPLILGHTDQPYPSSHSDTAVRVMSYISQLYPVHRYPAHLYNHES